MRWPYYAICLLFLYAAPSEAATGKQEILRKEKKLEDVQKQIREEKKTIREISEKETDILGELDGLNRNIALKKEELSAIEGSLSGMQRDVNSANLNISRLDSKKRALSEKLKARLRAMYRMTRGESAAFLFSSEASGMGRRHKYLSMIMDSDSRLISDYEKNIEDLTGERRRVASLYRGLEASKAEAAGRKRETEALQRAKIALLSEVKQEKGRRENVVKELEAAAEELGKLIEGLRGAPEEAAPGTGFASMKGNLPMPVEGPVVSTYGKVRHPRFQTVTFNNGIVIEAPVGAEVKSVYDGRVIYIGWLKGYGQVMIMDNGGGFYTLFAHLSRALKEKGEEAKRDEPIALVGDTGPEGRAGLYFEVRQKGVPRDPLAWLAAR